MPIIQGQIVDIQVEKALRSTANARSPLVPMCTRGIAKPAHPAVQISSEEPAAVGKHIGRNSIREQCSQCNRLHAVGAAPKDDR